MSRTRFVHFGALCSLCIAFVVSACSDDDTATVDGGAPDASASVADAAAAPGVDAGACVPLPLEIKSDLTVGPGCVSLTKKTTIASGTLTIRPGTTVRVAAGAYLAAEADNAMLVAVGSAAEPIVFTSDSASPQAGDWQCLYLKSSGSELGYVDIKYGGAPCAAIGSNPAAALVVAGSVKGVKNVTVTDSANYGVILNNGVSVRAFENNRFARNAKPSIQTHTSELVKLGAGNVFEKAGDHIEVVHTFGLGISGTIKKQPVPFKMTGELSIAAMVTIEPGVVLQLSGGGLVVFGTSAHLEAVGTPADKILFTSANASPAAGDWGCLELAGDQGTPKLEHVIIEYAGGTGCTGATDRRTAVYAKSSLVLRNSTIRKSAGLAVEAQDACTTKASEWCANTFEMNATGNIACTFAKTPLACM